MYCAAALKNASAITTTQDHGYGLLGRPQSTAIMTAVEPDQRDVGLE